MGDEVEMAPHLKSQASCRTWLTPDESTAAMYPQAPMSLCLLTRGLETQAWYVVFRYFSDIFVSCFSCFASKAERFSPANRSQGSVSYVWIVIS